MTQHPANQLFHALNKVRESNEEFHERMRDIARRAFSDPITLDINALDPLDPVRSSWSPAERDHDGDMGREQDDVDADNRRR